MTKLRRHYKNWRELAEKCMQSGMSVHSWCKANNIPPTTCRQWLLKLKKEGLPQTAKQDTELKIWGKVDLQQSERAASPHHDQIPSSIRLSYHDWNIEVKENFNPILLSQIIKVVDTIC
jgi:transposase-like protein